MPKPTDARIAAALAQGARVADVVALITDIQADIAAANAEADRLEALSIAVTTPEPEAEAAADAAAPLRRRATRMAAKVEQLVARVAELEASNRRTTFEIAYAAALERREALADDIREQWPDLTAGMVALFERIEASDAECLKLGGGYGKPPLASAESIARECRDNFVLPLGSSSQIIPRLTEMKIPALKADSSQAVSYGIWPKRAEPISYPIGYGLAYK